MKKLICLQSLLLHYVAVLVLLTDDGVSEKEKHSRK